jgi:hypothetical protein
LARTAARRLRFAGLVACAAFRALALRRAVGLRFGRVRFGALALGLRAFLLGRFAEDRVDRAGFAALTRSRRFRADSAGLRGRRFATVAGRRAVAGAAASAESAPAAVAVPPEAMS